MSILFAGERRAITGASFAGFDFSSRKTKSGERVTFDTAMGLDAVAAVVGLFCDVVYMLPVATYRDGPGAGDPMTTSPSLVKSPSLYVDARTWRAQAMMSWLLWGNAYGLVASRDQHGYPATVEWLDPESVTVEERSLLSPAVYRVGGEVADPGQILHIPGRYVRPGTRVGLAPLERFKETFGLALAARNFGAQWFGDGAHPSAILSTDSSVTQEQATTIKARFVAALRGKREPVVLGQGIKYDPIQSTPSDSQMIEAKVESTAAVARAMGLMQPEMVGIPTAGGGTVTYANREQRAIDFLTFSADPYLVRFEDLYTRNIPSPQYAKFNRGALLRTDMLTRYQAHDTAIRGGFRSPDQARGFEDEAPIPDGKGDVFLWPPYSTAPTPTQGAST